MRLIDQIRRFNPCPDAVEWLDDKTFDEAWDTCERGDWTLWAYARLYPERNRELVGCAAECAATVRHLMTDSRSIEAIEACRRYAAGEISKEELQTYADAAADAAYAAATTAASYAAATAAATYAAAAAADAAAAAAATYAAYATTDAAYAAARKENLKLTADICRRLLKCS